MRFSQDGASRDYVKFLALVSPFGGFYFGATSITVFEVMAPLLLWFSLRGTRQIPQFTIFYIAYCVIAVLSSALVFLLDGAGFGIRTFAVALRQFLLFSPFLLVFGIRDFDLALARQVNDRFLLGCGVAMIGGMMLHFMGIQVQDNQQMLWLERGADPVLRAGGLVGNSGSFGLQAALWFTSWFLVRPALGQKMPAALSMTVAVVTAAALFYSASRGGILQITAAMVLGLASGAIRVRAGAVLGALGLSLVATFAVMAGAIRINTDGAEFTQLARLDFLNLSGQGQFTESVRLQLFEYFIDIFQSNALMGIGYKMTVPKFGQPLDNAFLLAYFETGIIAGTLFVAFWGALLFHFVRRSMFESWFAPIGLALCASFVLRMMVMGAHTAWNAAPGFFILAAILIRLTEQRTRLTKPKR
ncbi:MAG: O-antigen ligase [Paracoccaceae bacterium]|jgi:O-antigen ligase